MSIFAKLKTEANTAIDTSPPATRLTKAQLDAIAKTIKHMAVTGPAKTGIVRAFAYVLADMDPHFDRTSFFHAVGVDSGNSKLVANTVEAKKTASKVKAEPRYELRWHQAGGAKPGHENGELVLYRHGKGDKMVTVKSIRGKTRKAVMPEMLKYVKSKKIKLPAK